MILLFYVLMLTVEERNDIFHYLHGQHDHSGPPRAFGEQGNMHDHLFQGKKGYSGDKFEGTSDKLNEL